MMKLTAIVAALAALGMAGCQPAPVVAADGPAPAPAGPQTTTAFGVAFDHAAGLGTRPCDGDMPRCAILFDPAAEAFMRDLLTVQVYDGPLETVAAAEAGFERDAEGRLMTTYGRFEPVAVEAFEVNGEPGLRAVVACGVSDPETGFHAAAGECLWAVVSDGTRSVVVSSSGFGNGLEAAEKVVGSIRFTTD
ncbi:MAG: hypothetical protein KJ690_14105 [Alphaproteobacteria bacterium]|nr:hypothetical protein [Alphaproteobacteria bacterium]MBU4137530.1 hypothetical protein [Alphaproteobacteria bacterium]